MKSYAIRGLLGALGAWLALALVFIGGKLMAWVLDFMGNHPTLMFILIPTLLGAIIAIGFKYDEERQKHND